MLIVTAGALLFGFCVHCVVFCLAGLHTLGWLSAFHPNRRWVLGLLTHLLVLLACCVGLVFCTVHLNATGL